MARRKSMEMPSKWRVATRAPQATQRKLNDIPTGDASGEKDWSLAPISQNSSNSRTSQQQLAVSSWWLVAKQVTGTAKFFSASEEVVDDLFIVSQFECWVGILGVKLSSRMGEDVIKSASRELRVRLRNLA